MTQVAQRNNHVLQMLKRLKETLENEKKKYADKVNVLVMTWERIAASAREQRPLAAICIVEKMYKDTLNIMLQGEWPKMSPVSKTHLMQMLNRCRIDLCKEMPWLHSKFRKLLELVNDPWTLPSLERIMHKDPSPATPEQIIEFCESERGLLIVTRLNMLCSSRCEKVAIKLAEACFNALTTANSSLLSLFTINEYNFIFDIYLCLLYKYKKLESIINSLKPVSVSNGYALVLRLKRRSNVHEQKIWKFSIPVATIAARYFVTVSMLSRSIPNSIILKNLIKDWLCMYNTSENNLENEIRKIIQPAETSEHIYIMAEVLASMSQQTNSQIYSSLIMELYIRALTADINYLERVKLQNDREQMTAYEKHLAAKFLDMADLVKDHGGVRREFVLTAFSIHPSAEIYRRVEEEAVASGKASPHSTPTSQESMEVGVLSEGLSSLSSEEPDVKETAVDYSVNNDSQDSGAFVEISNRCSLHLPYDGIGPEGELCFQCGDFTGVQTSRNLSDPQQTKKERSLDALILIKGNTVTESLNYDVLSAPSQVLEAEKLGLSSQVCADLVTLLGSNRYHLLTWVLEWGELSSRCLRYMEEADTIKSGKKELKFLEIDYNQYKDWPENEDEADCIEKGYEQWLEDDNTETDFDTDSKRSNTDDSEEMSMLKTAIRRSQKQLGRYAESSSDSDDSRARNKSKKRSRAKKRYKFVSDSGSVSDSLGSDGQKQKRSGKKQRKPSKDLRKRLCSLRVLDVAADNSLSLNNEKISSDILDNQLFGLPTTLATRSDPTVLKSLRAFRLNAHKSKQKDFVNNMTKNYQNSKSHPGKVISVSKKSVFDCNDNKFITRNDNLAIGTKDLEMHFKASGVKTKKYNDFIRTIKEDLISVSNIPSIPHNATVQVVHLHDTAKSQEVEQSHSTEVSATETQTVSAPPASVSTEIDVISNQKMKPVNESHGSHISRNAASQSLNQTAETVGCAVPTTGKTYLSTALTRSVPSSRMVGSGFNNVVTVVSRGDSNRVVNQPHLKAVVNRSVANQNRLGSNEGANNRSIINFQLTSAEPVTNNSTKNTGQNVITPFARSPVQTTRTSTPIPSETAKMFQDSERQYTTASRNYSVQSNRSNAPTFTEFTRQLAEPVQSAAAETSKNSFQSKKMKDSHSSSSNDNIASLESIKPVDVSNSVETSSSSRLLMQDVPCTVNADNTERASIPTVKIHSGTSAKIVEQLTGTKVIVNPTSNISNTKMLPVKSTTEEDLQNINGGYFPQNNSNSLSKSCLETNVIATTSLTQRPPNNKVVQKVGSDRVKLELNTNSSQRNYSSSQVNGTKRNAPAGAMSISITQIPSNAEDIHIFPSSCEKYSTSSGQIKTPSILSGILLDGRNSPVALSPISSVGNRSYTNSPNMYTNKTNYVEVRNVIQDVKLIDINPSSSSLTCSASLPLSSSTNVLDCDSLTTRVTSSEEKEIIDSPAVSYEDKGSSAKNLQNRNILATILKQNSTTKAGPATVIPQYNTFTTRNAVDQSEPTENVLISQSSSSNTIHYTVINPNTTQQTLVNDDLNPVPDDMMERVVRQDDFSSPRSVLSPESNQIKTSTFDSVVSSAVAGEQDTEKYSFREDACFSEQKVIVPSKKVKSNSSQSIGPTDTGLIKKQVFNNQKITILVQNNGENQDDAENQQKANKLSEFLLRDDKKTCITFRAIKRTQPNVSVSESPPIKKGPQNTSSNQNGEVEITETRDNIGTSVSDETSSAGTLCQYLVLEAINDPSGALPKFNQAFGKSYQIKVPQPVKTLEPNESREGDVAIQMVQGSKSEGKLPMEPDLTSLPQTNQAPSTDTGRGNSMGVGSKSVKNVYIDKEVKTDVQTSLKASDGTLDSSASIPAIHMTEIQQPNVNAFQNVSKVARSTVVQQLIRKVPTTGPSTLQAVSSFSAINSRQVKSQDVVTAPTLIYATAARAQSQILIQRAVGRVNAPTISQVAPVIYAQQPNDQAAAQTQTLLLAAVPTGTRSVVPGTQLVRLPSNSGIWRMAPSVSPSRIVQLRPQNLVLQGNQDQGVLMHSTQPVLLHHLTSLPVKPIGVVANPVKSDETVKIDLKNDIYVKGEGSTESTKMCSLEVQQTPTRTDSSSPVATSAEHETVALMKDIKEFENVFEETKLKFEMEEQQGVCLPEVENVSEAKTQTLTTVDVNHESQSLATHQTVLVQPQLMLHKPQMIITSAGPSQQNVFRQKIEKEFTIEKDSEERLLLTQKSKKDIQPGMEEGTQQSHVTLAYVSHPPTPSAIQKPLVVVTNYAQPPSSPAPSITSQSSSSPNSVVGATSFSSSTSSAKAAPKPKARSMKTVSNPSKSPPVSKPQQKPQEDANTAQKIYAILEEYAVQLRNSPDMNNRPAPRRRSNPPTSASSKRKRTVCKSKESLSDGDDGAYSEDVTEMLPSSEDSSSGVTVLQ